MTLSIAEAMHQAHEALNSGDYSSASVTCTQLVNQFPGYALAYGLLGEAYREQGQLAEARDAFVAAFVRHQRNPGVYLGLGLIAEDEGSPENAIAFCQVAWELAPERRQMREPLIRVAMRRYGSDGDLQFSRAALAQVHTSGSRLRRAVEEYRRALVDLPDRVDLRLGLAECLWRLGHDADAMQIAGEVLEQYPESAPALVILADVEHREGHTRRADDFLKRLRAVDPDGAIVASMLAGNPHANHAFLAVPDATIPRFSEAMPHEAAERPRIAPAPDFEYRPVRAEMPAPPLEDLEPISFEEFGGSAEAFEPISLDEIGGLPEGVQPISPEEFGAPAGEDDYAFEGLEPVTADELGETSDALVDDTQAAEAGSELGFEDFSTEPLGATPRIAGHEVGAPGTDTVESFAPSAGLHQDDWSEIISDEDLDSFEAAGELDDLSALAAALEGDVAEALSRAGEPVVQDVDTSRPPTTPPSGYTTVLQSLGDAGLAPFDPRELSGDEGREAAMPSPEDDDRLLEQARPSGQPADLESVTGDWDSIDDEIRRAVPEGIQHGHTEELRALSDIGLSPFDVDETSDSAGLSSQADSGAQPAQEAAPGVDDELLNGLEPFAFEEFEVPGMPQPAPQPQRQGARPAWDAESGVSAVPSDEDLDALLAHSDEQEIAPQPMVPTAAEVDLEIVPEAAGSETTESDLRNLIPGLTEHDLDAEIDQSLAATRELPIDVTPDSIERSIAQTAQIEAPNEATDIPEDVLPDATLQPFNEVDVLLPESLRPGTELFNRARKVKEGMMSEGIISGTRELIDGISTDELIALDDASSLQQSGDVEPHEAESDDEDVLMSTSSSRDMATLRSALEISPDDDELRWWLAEGLRERGDMTDAFAEYRWLIRNAPHRQDAVQHALHECIERDQSPEMAHRLLGDIYRRRGDVTRASNHAAMALRQRRRVR